MRSVIIQGYEGSFHDEASAKYFGENIEIIPADSFDELIRRYASEPAIDHAMMAIENSIAGSILPNYRLLRESALQVIGEIYHPIRMQLMAPVGKEMSDLIEIHSHPMAIRQCLKHLSAYPTHRMVETSDTAWSAREIAAGHYPHAAAIASRRAAEIFHLDILAEDIHDDSSNFTRFFALSRDEMIPSEMSTKASICVRVSHAPGSLRKLLQIIEEAGINLSKIQSLPVLGEPSTYFFHMDLEFAHVSSYLEVKEKLQKKLDYYKELGVYRGGEIS